jgi:hypothetical protein
VDLAVITFIKLSSLILTTSTRKWGRLRLV